MAWNGRAFTPARTREYEKLVSRHATEACRIAGWEVADGTYAMEVAIQRQRYVGDLDNFLKSISDGCNQIVFPDDAMVAHVRAWFVDVDRKQPGVLVRISRVETIEHRKTDVDGLGTCGKTE